MSAVQKLFRVIVVLAAMGVVVLAAMVFWQFRQRPFSRGLTSNLDVGVLTGVEVEGEKDAFPMSALAGRVGDLKYPLNESGVTVGRIYKKNPDGTVSRVNLGDLTDDDQVFVDFYRRGNIVRGIISGLTNDNGKLTFRLFDDDTADRYSADGNLPFEVEDPSGMFWASGKGIDNLKIGDAVELNIDEDNVSKLKYLAPVLGAGRGRIKIVSGQPERKIIEIEGSPLKIYVDKDTIVHDGKLVNVKYDLTRVVDGVNVFVLYYMDKGTMRAKSIGVGI